VIDGSTQSLPATTGHTTHNLTGITEAPKLIVSPHTPCVRERPGRYQYAVTYKGQPALTFTLFGTRPNRHYFLATRVLHLCLYFDSFKRQSVYLIVFTTPHTVSFYPFLLRTYWKRNF
jgi:hypothetical protein